MSLRPRSRRLPDLKSVPVLPSLITLGNLFFGFLAMAKVTDAVRGGGILDDSVLSTFETAALFIFLAMVFDALDGRIARMTNQTTAFGAQLDSLADLLTFGVAPAFIAKALINLYEGPPTELLPPHPKLYYFCAAVYVLCAAMRLARFNVEATSDEKDHRAFEGLPTPGAAAVVCSLVAFHAGARDQGNLLTRWLLPEGAHEAVVAAMPAVLVLLGLLMVSRVPFPHLFYALVRRRHSFPFLATTVVMIGLVAVEWQLAFVLATGSYVVAGLSIGIYRVATRGRMDDDPGDGDGDGDGDDAADTVAPGRGLPEPHRN